MRVIIAQPVTYEIFAEGQLNLTAPVVDQRRPVHLVSTDGRETVQYYVATTILADTPDNRAKLAKLREQHLALQTVADGLFYQLIELSVEAYENTTS